MVKNEVEVEETEHRFSEEDAEDFLSMNKYVRAVGSDSRRRCDCGCLS